VTQYTSVERRARHFGGAHAYFRSWCDQRTVPYGSINTATGLTGAAGACASPMRANAGTPSTALAAGSPKSSGGSAAIPTTSLCFRLLVAGVGDFGRAGPSLNMVLVFERATRLRVSRK
jgi:hypothetical protein